MKVITVAAGIVMNEQQQLLLVRKKNTSCFMQVGGKLEVNELPEQTIIREIEEEIDSKIDELISLKLEATGLINKLDVQENLLLDMRYIGKKGWKVIAAAFGYEERNVHRLHSKALNRLDEILEKHVRKCQ